jgi:hypothetical protein
MFTIQPTRKIYYNTDSNESRIQIYKTKIQVTNKVNKESKSEQDTNRTKTPEDKH